MNEPGDRDRRKRRPVDTRKRGLRHEVGVPARIAGAQGSFMDATIHDVSASGMSIRHPLLVVENDAHALPVGTRISVTFAPDHEHAPDDTVSVSAEIARSEPHGVGVRFVNLSREQRQALRLLAALAVEARVTSGAGLSKAASRASRPEIRALMGACLRVIERRLPNLIWTLRTEVVKRLQKMGSSGTDEAKQARAEAERIDSKSTAIGLTIERRVVQSFAEVVGLDVTQELLLQQVRRESTRKKAQPRRALGLVESEAFEVSVAMEAASERLEKALVSKSFDVNVRLANVLGRRIDKVENPLVPAVLCRMLWQSVTEYCDSPRVHECLHRVLVERLIPLMSEIYDELGQTLDQHDVPAEYWTSDSTYDGKT